MTDPPPSPRDTKRLTATAAGGTHPAGMHSCSDKKNRFTNGDNNGHGAKNVTCKQTFRFHKNRPIFPSMHFSP